MGENEYWIKFWRNISILLFSLALLLNISFRLADFQENQEYSNRINKYSKLEGKTLDFAVCMDSASAYAMVLCVDIIRADK